jgi:cytochrome c
VTVEVKRRDHGHMLERLTAPARRLRSVKLILVALATGVLLGGHQSQAEGQTSDAGADVFRRCMACHQVGPSARNGVGPVLNGSVGRHAGTHPGYSYSAAMRNSGLVWNEQTLTRYLRAPRDVVPGTKMAFAGMKDDRDIADVIDYLKQFGEEGQKVHE